MPNLATQQNQNALLLGHVVFYAVLSVYIKDVRGNNEVAWIMDSLSTVQTVPLLVTLRQQMKKIIRSCGALPLHKGFKARPKCAQYLEHSALNLILTFIHSSFSFLFYSYYFYSLLDTLQCISNCFFFLLQYRYKCM